MDPKITIHNLNVASCRTASPVAHGIYSAARYCSRRTTARATRAEHAEADDLRGILNRGLEFARAIRGLLRDDAEITLWNEGFFRVGSLFIDTLISAVSRFDFAILVLTPDDLVQSRNVASLGPRDNLLFELGLFMGRLGRARTFIVHQADLAMKIPSDQKLRGLASADPFLLRFHNHMIDELHHLDAIRYVRPKAGHGMTSLRDRDGSDRPFDLKQYCEITADGLEYLKLRDELMAGAASDS